MRKYICILLALGWGCVASASEIVAIVNDTPISSYDVTMRMKMLELQQPGFSSSEPAKTLRKKVLEQLIDEKVKKQEGEKRGFKVTDKDVAQAGEHMERQLGLQKGGLRALLAQHGIPYKAVEEQIISDLYWLQVMHASDLPLTAVSEADVKNRMAFLKNELKVPGYLVSEIWVSDKEAADNVDKELKMGHEFDGVAGRYSTVPSAAQGGMLGWIKQGYYPADIEKVLEGLEPGHISPPIKTDKGYAFILLHDKKAPSQVEIDVWEMAQMGIPEGKISPVLESMLKTLHDCNGFIELAKNIAIEPSIRRGQLNPGQLPNGLKEKMMAAQENEVVGPYPMSGVQMFFMACAKKKQSLLPKEEAVREQLGLEQVEALSDKLLRSLRKKAVVEYKS